MRMSDKGRALLTKREGVRLKAYKDSVGIWTIGIGHTSAAGPPHVTPDLVITAAECDQIFSRDLVQYENAVNSAVKVELRQNEFDALVSFCYNIGTGGLKKSHTVSLLNQGFRNEAADAMLGWSKPPEIIGRRRTEIAQFKTPYTGAVTVPAPPDVPPVISKPKPPPPVKSTTGAVIVAGGSTAAAAAKAGFTPLQVVIAVVVVIAAVIGGVVLYRKFKKG